MSNLNSSMLAELFQEETLANRPIVLALSGGVDSVALLLLLVELRQRCPIKLSAIHVHHGLSDNADNWSEFVEQLCVQHQVPLMVSRVSLEPKSRVSMEQQARDARYQAVAEYAPHRSLVCTAHHSGDQAETLLLRLMRGAGSTGLSAIRQITAFPNSLGRAKALDLVRPLLSFSKQSLKDHVLASQASWVEDESNRSDDYDRNFVRNRVLPLLASRWPQAADSICKSARVLAQEADLLNDYLRDELAGLLQRGFLDQLCLDLQSLGNVSPAKQQALLRLFIFERIRQYPSLNRLEQICQQMLNAKEDQQPSVQIGPHVARRHRNLLYIEPDYKFGSDPLSLLANREQELQHPYFRQICIRDSMSDETEYEIRYACLSQRLKTSESGHRKPVKQILKELGCPAWYRKTLPLIFLEDRLVAIADLLVDVEFKSRVVVSLTQRK